MWVEWVAIIAAAGFNIVLVRSNTRRSSQLFERESKLADSEFMAALFAIDFERVQKKLRALPIEKKFQPCGECGRAFVSRQSGTCH